MRAGDALVTDRLAAGYDGGTVLRDVSLRIPCGTLTALIGPNGAGKTTLLHALAGIHPRSAGEILLDGEPLAALSRRAIARRLALVPQFSEVTAAVTVEETVSLGRYPWIAPLASASRADRAAIEEAIEWLDLGELRDRPLTTLSGGERQRALLARALAQATPILLLDEPAANLDLRYQQEVFELLRSLVREKGVTILVAEHQLNLVAATCDRLLCLHDGRLLCQGAPHEVVTDALLRDVFGARMRVLRAGEAEGAQCVWDL
jgi:iron complex transport system ATP-binding protein